MKTFNKIINPVVLLSLLMFNTQLFALASSSVNSSNKIHHYTFSNGLQLFVKTDNKAPVVISQLWYKVGSSYEKLGITGISHVLEHMMFQGTKKYSSDTMTELVAKHGGIQNAMTANDYTMYYQKLPANNLAISFKLEADRMHNLILSKKRFVKELNVVLEEKRMRIDNNPQALTLLRFLALANIGTNYQHPTIGWRTDLDSLNVGKLKKWYEQYYAPNNAVLVVVGKVEPDKVYKLAKKYFARIQAEKITTAAPTMQAQPFGERRLIVKAPAKLAMLYLGYNVPVVKTAAKNYVPYALLLIAAILDLGNSSRFEKILVRKKQIATMIDTYYNPFSRLANVLMISAIPNKNHSIKELQNEILLQLTNLKTELVSNRELRRIKNQIIAQKIYSRDSVTAQASEIGSLESVGLSWKIADNFVANIGKITPLQIQATAKTFLSQERQTTTILQPTAMKKGK